VVDFKKEITIIFWAHALSTQLPFTGTQKERITRIQFWLNFTEFWDTTIKLVFRQWLTILAMQVPFQKALAQRFARHYCSSKRQIYIN